MRPLLPALLLTLLACHRVMPPDDTAADTAKPDDSAHDSGDDSADDSGDSGHVDAELREFSLLSEGTLNHLLPVKSTIDVAGRRMYTISASVGTVAEIDIDSGELVALHSLGDEDIRQGAPCVDGLNQLWIGSSGAHYLVRLRAEDGDVATFGEQGVVHAVACRPEGGVYVAANLHDEEVLQRVGTNGRVEAQGSLGGTTTGLAWTADGTHLLAILYPDGGDQELAVVDPDTFEISVELPISPGAATLAPLQGGAIAFASGTEISTLAADHETLSSVREGGENTSVFAVGDGDFLVADRNGPESLGGPFYGAVRWLDSSLSEVQPAFESGFNSGFGGYDPVRGLVWLNSEGTTQAWALDPTTGEVVHRVTLGQHTEWALPDPDNPDIVYFTGRLSGTVGRIDLGTGDLTLLDEGIRWPVQPMLVDGTLWVLDETTTLLYGLDPDTLTIQRTVDPGLGTNPMLTFDQLGWDPDRGVAWLTDPWINTLAQVDLTSGSTLATWELGGTDSLPDWDKPGRLQYVRAGEAIITLRTNDLVLSRVEPDGAGLTLSTTVDRADAEDIVGGSPFQRLSASADGATIYIGGVAFDALTLARDAGADVPAELLLRADNDGGWLAWDQDQLVHIDASGAIAASVDLPFDHDDIPMMLTSGEGAGRLGFGVFASATVGVLDLAPLY